MAQTCVLKENYELGNISTDNQKSEQNESTLANFVDDHLIEKDFENDAFPRSFVIDDEGEKIPFALQKSLFHNVCPTLYFGSSQEKSKLTLPFTHHRLNGHYHSLNFSFLFKIYSLSLMNIF